MSSFDTTDPDLITAALAKAIQSIVPRYLPQQTKRFTYTKDQEVQGTIRNFDLILQPEVDVTPGWYGGGIQLKSATEIRISYPLSEPEVRRFVGADGQDLAGILVRLHLTVPGMFPVAMGNPDPIFEIIINGLSGAYVASFFTELHFFASDTVQVA